MAPVYIRITNGKRKIETSTGHFIKLADWNSKTHTVKSTNAQAKHMNDSLQSLRSKAMQIHNNLIADGKPFSLSVIKNKLTDKDQNHTTLLNAIQYHNALVEKGIGKNYALNTYKGYLWFTNKVKSFMMYQYHRSDILLVELNHRFLTEFEHYLYHILHNQANTVQKNITQLRKIINLCIDLDWLDKMPFKRLKQKSHIPQRDHLNSDELQRMENMVINNNRLRVIRDMFVFQCYTGLAYIDLKQLTHNHIVKGIDGDDWIIINRQKTKSRSTIPVLTKAKELIEIYYTPTRETVFPVCSNQKFNNYLKELSSFCKINKRVTTHTGRRTFATTITLSNGVPIETVSRMLGHNDLKTTSIYAKVVDTKVSEDMKKVMEKLELKPGDLKII